jgi:murein L,D-transpeptidase YcbB/YkuD
MKGSGWVFVAWLLCGLVIPVTSQASLEEEIFGIFDTLAHGVQPRSLPESVYARDTLSLFYGQRDYEPAWHEYDYIKQVLAELAASEKEGLNPEDYHYSTLKSLEAEYFASRRDSERDRLHAAFDVLLSDGVLLYARHLQEGKVNPAQVEPTWNFPRRDFEAQRVATSLSEAIAQGNVVERLGAFKPRLRFYHLMKDELVRYRRLAAEYELLNLPEDTVLKPGMRHPNVRILRTQLTRLGFEGTQGSDSELFDEELQGAVERFQRRHSLGADGVVGRNSFRELNTPYTERVDQLRLNLDRVRWVQDDIVDELVLVNIPGYELYFFHDAALAWQTDVMVGTIRTQTPIFRADMSYLEFNPTWTVPRSIIGRSLYSKFAADPNYVTEHNYTLYSSDGTPVDPATIDWSQYSRKRFPFRVVQQPGPGNALGRVKFMFPNQYAVYLHDTPSRALFSRTSRAFSAGCVRVRDPLHFADLLLADEQGWNRERIDQVVDSEKRTVVRFGAPVDVMLMYWTTSPDPDSGIQFHPDIYNRDAKTLALLKEKPRWDAL